ncbi:hypothetical protein U0070_001318 [Myodes glareolus]|uniref:Ornithine decarboxylase n=1 Tax=Myodes glareolus TaxID=447135 RepID=A0AAW0HZ48_MYOGA
MGLAVGVLKSNDSRAIVNALAAVGTGFDCASKTEIQLVQGLWVPPERIIYANPCKQVSQIKYAASSGVQMMTLDSEIELMTVTRAHPKAKLVLWIATDDSKAVCRLSVKFGATLKTSRLLLERAKELNIDVIGVSFHVGEWILRPSCKPCRMPAVSLMWEQKLVSACICLILAVAFLDLRIRSLNLKRSPV